MMRKILTLAVMMFVVSATSIMAQVTVNVTLDSAQIFIGQRVGVTLEVSADRDKEIHLPEYDSLQQIVPGVEFVSATDIDSSLLNEGKRVVLTRKYYITSFDSALYYLPPMQVMVDTTVYTSKNLALKVYTFDVDTAHVDSIFPAYGVMAPEFAFEDDWAPVIYTSLAISLLALLLIYVVIRLKDNKPIIRRIKLRQRLAPHKVAMQKIEQIKQDELSKTDEPKVYYTELTNTLRQYITDRFGFNAMELTTSEIVDKLYAEDDKEAIGELHELFLTADLVKFAKYKTEINENDRNLLTAIDYINQTKKEEELKPQPEEIVVEEKGSKQTKVVIMSAIGVSSVAVLCLLAYLVYKLILMYI